jgi:hypothetical protein
MSQEYLLCWAAGRFYAARQRGYRPRLLTPPFDGKVEAFRKTGGLVARLSNDWGLETELVFR